MRLISVIISTGIIGLISCHEKSLEVFEISGKIRNSNARMIYLEETPMVAMQRILLDSSIIGKDGSYSLKAKQKEESILNLRMDKDVYPFASVISDVSKIKLDADFSNSQELYTIEGSKASMQMKEYLSNSGEKIRNIYSMNLQIDSLVKLNQQDSINILALKRNSDAGQLKRYTAQLINSSESPSLALFILGSYQSLATNPSLQLQAFSNQEVGNFINESQKKFPDHQGIAVIKKNFDIEMEKSAGLIGKTAPEIELPDVNGKEVSLSSFKGKFVLVDFWASWCKPCRFENPYVVKAFNKYRDKNFTILGVSLDQDRNEWKKAIEKDGLVWTHISDLKYWNSKVVSVYNIEGIPYNVLINPDGKVIAENLHGPALDAKLSEVLK